MEVEALKNLSSAGINHDVAILARLIKPSRDDLSPEAAQAILALDFDPEDRDRMHQLAMKAQEGILAQEEQREIDSYERVGHLLALLKSTARRSLRRASAGK